MEILNTTPLFTIPPYEKENLYKILKINKYTPILLAGSIHRGEHEIILDTYQTIKKKCSALILIIAPRELKDIELILNKINHKFTYFRRKKIEDKITSHTTPDIVLLETFGELKKFYSIATIAILGGSFLPLNRNHNILEPANFVKPIIIGPYMREFSSFSELFVKEKGALLVNNQVELTQVIIKLLANKNLRQKYGRNAYNILKKTCAKNNEALQHTLKVIDHILR